MSLLSGQTAKKKEAVIDLGRGVKMEFVLIPAGKFTMGSPRNEDRRDDDEEQHEVAITRDFYMGKYEVTQEQYSHIAGINPSWYSADGMGNDTVAGLNTGRFPVERVTWQEATAFCGKLTELHGKG